MRPLSAQEQALPTDRRLLLVAERLFAERGIGATSLRSVMAAAGANVAAVHYHFGSKEGLVAALVRERTDELHERRMALLEAAGTPTVTGLAEALARPVVDLVASGAADWVRVVGQLIDVRGEPSEVSAVFDAQWQAWDAAYDTARPGLGPAARAFRLGQAWGLAIRVLGELDGHVAWLREKDPAVDRETVVSELLGALAALLAGPETVD